MSDSTPPTANSPLLDYTALSSSPVVTDEQNAPHSSLAALPEFMQPTAPSPPPYEPTASLCFVAASPRPDLISAPIYSSLSSRMHSLSTTDPVPELQRLPPPPSGPPPAPHFRLTDEKNLPFLTPTPEARLRFFPWANPELVSFGIPITPRTDTPPWSLTLELYYRVFHPYAWEILEEELAEQAEYTLRQKKWIEHRQRLGAGEADLDALRAERTKVVKSLWQMFSGLYGLHFIRERYLEHYRPLAPRWDDSRIIQETLDFERGWDRQPLVFGGPRDHSVWPLPLPSGIIPPHYLPLIDHRDGLICLCDLTAEARRPHWLPPTSMRHPFLLAR
ncbi:hypothetical protein JCM10207_002808 [Rhodosporidiobolus poonsookiae]